MHTIGTKMPREINSWRAAALLYGDLGTSKAYVLGLAFAVAGYSSFWFILAVSILTLLVGLNYIEICRLYPNGGGVYTSAKSRSKNLALLGGFFLISDYLITAALSAVSAFHYLGVDNPEYFAILSIVLIGLFNLVGPKRTGNLAIILAIPTLLSIICLTGVSLPFLHQAASNVKPVSGNLGTDWAIFVSIIVALSGIESISNTTGSMKLDPGSTHANPTVTKTSTKAILMVILEVSIFTTLLGLAMHALGGLEISNGDINAPGYPNVRDSMLRYMGLIFGGDLFGAAFGQVFSIIISIVISVLLLSAVNTSIIALISLLYTMAKDGEMPEVFQKLNRFGVPIYPTFISLILPSLVLLFTSDILILASLYAIGFVGAITINLGSTSTNFKLDLSVWKRIFMFLVFLVMLFVEITLFVDKPHARIFVLLVLAGGFLVRSLAGWRQQKFKAVLPENASWTKIPENAGKSCLIAVTEKNSLIKPALEDAKKHHVPVYILFVREQKFVTKADESRSWDEDKEAFEVFQYVLNLEPKPNIPMEFLYSVSSHSSYSIVEIAKMKNVSRVVVVRRRGLFLLHMLRGTTIREFRRLLPADIDLGVVD